MVTLARQGARVIGVDPSLARIEAARAAVDEAEVKVELHQGDLAELPFVRADSLDGALSVFALAGVDDLDRRLPPGPPGPAPRVPPRASRSPTRPTPCSIPTRASRPTVVRAYFDRSSRPWSVGDEQGDEYPRTIGDLFTSLSRANFRVDTLLEPEPAGGRAAPLADAMRWAPATLILRARKEGI